MGLGQLVERIFSNVRRYVARPMRSRAAYTPAVWDWSIERHEAPLTPAR